jgi:putative ABC transport system permease protein
MNPWPLVVAELRRNRGGCVAIVALIAIAVALGIAVSAQERALREASTRAADRFDLIVGAPGGATQLVLSTVYLQPAPLELLPVDMLDRLAREPGAQAVAPVAVTDSFEGYVVVGTSAGFAAAQGLAQGRAFADAHEAIIGSAVRIAVGTTLRPAHGSAAENVLEAHDHEFDLNVVGRARSTGTPWDRAIIVPIEGIWAMHAGTRGTPDASGGAGAAPLALPWTHASAQPVPAIVVKPRSVSDAYQLRAKYRGKDTLAVFPAEVLLPLYALLGDMRELMAWMALAFQLLLIVAVMLVIVATLAGRRHMLGVLRALGAPPAFVLLTLWLQAAVLIAAGIVAGTLAGAALSLALGAIVSERTGLMVNAWPGAAEAWLLAALLVAGSLLAALPSMAAMRMSTSRLLRAG